MTSRARLLALGLGAAACAPPDRGPRFQPAGATSPREGGALRFAMHVAVRTLDPTVSGDETTGIVHHALFDSLVDYAPASLTIVPRLAERWEVSADGLHYRFWLRRGITFADGAPITAAHFKYSLERALTTADSPYTEYLRNLTGADDTIAHRGPCRGIVAADDLELELSLDHADPALLAILTLPFATPQRAEHLARVGDQVRRIPDATGPFELAQWDEGRRLVMRRNPRYYDRARARLDEIVLIENIARDTQFQMFERGEIDTAEKLATPDLLYVLGSRAWAPYIFRTTPLNVFGSRMNTRVAPFDDRRVRQALNYALDKRHTSRLLNGTSVDAHGILPPGMLGYDDSLKPYPHDVARARALLAEAGIPEGYELDYVTYSDEETEKMAASLQSDLAQVGIRLHIQPLSFDTYQTTIGKPDGAAFSLAAWGADFADPVSFIEANFHSRQIRTEASVNNTFYADPELDAVLDAARRTPHPAERAALYRRAERMLFDAAPWIWDYHRTAIEVRQPYVKGDALHPIWLRDYTSAWLDVGADDRPVER